MTKDSSALIANDADGRVPPLCLLHKDTSPPGRRGAPLMYGGAARRAGNDCTRVYDMQFDRHIHQVTCRPRPPTQALTGWRACFLGHLSGLDSGSKQGPVPLPPFRLLHPLALLPAPTHPACSHTLPVAWGNKNSLKRSLLFVGTQPGVSRDRKQCLHSRNEIFVHEINSK